MGPAISSGLPARRKGMIAVIFSPSAAIASFDMSVATHPGATQLTRILCGANSGASDLVKLIIAPLVAA